MLDAGSWILDKKGILLTFIRYRASSIPAELETAKCSNLFMDRHYIRVFTGMAVK
jgi:hypothetical protein